MAENGNVNAQASINPDHKVGVDAVGVPHGSARPFFIYVSGSQARVRPDGTAELGPAVETFFDTPMSESHARSAETAPDDADAVAAQAAQASSEPAATEPAANEPAASGSQPPAEAAAETAISDADAHALDAMKRRKSEEPLEAIEVINLDLPGQIEALLYVAGEPVPVTTLAQALDVNAKDVEAALDVLEETYRHRGVRLQRAGNKLQLVSAPEMAARVQKFLGLEAINKLSPAALETLAIIAYKQPITRPQLEMIRGVNSDGVMHTLIQRNLVQELGRADTVGYPMRYGVSFEFLQYFGLKGTHELPRIENIETVKVEQHPALPTETPVAQPA